jgi:hypothetical protein
MYSPTFWEYFDNFAAPKLKHPNPNRSETYRAMFTYLDRLNRPVGIVETGSTRTEDDFMQGQSTVLFDHYAATSTGSVVYSVDIDLRATELCKSLVSDRVKVYHSDSVKFLAALAHNRPRDLPAIDLLYLDSFDVDWRNPLRSAIHHLKELLAISRLLSPDTLVAIDDSALHLFGNMNAPNSLDLIPQQKPYIGGKGMLVAEYAETIGVKPYFIGYQCGWIGLS